MFPIIGIQFLTLYTHLRERVQTTLLHAIYILGGSPNLQPSIPYYNVLLLPQETLNVQNRYAAAQPPKMAYRKCEGAKKCPIPSNKPATLSKPQPY